MFSSLISNVSLVLFGTDPFSVPFHPPPVDVYNEGVARSCKPLIERQKHGAGFVPQSSPSSSKTLEEWAHYPHPFRSFGQDAWTFDDADLPRALVELKMCAISNEIREKDRWWEKVNDETIRVKWKEDVKEHEAAETNVKWRLTEKMVRLLSFSASGI